jgi:probable F420-dependent oxidoreductase
MLTFGFTLKLDWKPQEVVDMTKAAEAAGFSYGWVFDSHVLWEEPFPYLTMMANATKKMRLGCCVTNPVVRDVTVAASLHAALNNISGGRMDLGIGRGDSSRRVMGKKPTTMAVMEESIQQIRDLCAGKAINYEGQEIQMTWAHHDIPVWVAGYGPKVLNLTGRVADGVILQFADPHLIKWCMGFLHEGARQAGRDPNSIQVMAAAPAYIHDDIKVGREHVRWFPALVSNHVVDLVNRYSPDELPAELTTYIRDRKGYDYHEHAGVDAKHASFVSDEVVDRFCVIGTAQQVTDKLRELESIGVTQFNLYLMNSAEKVGSPQRCADETRMLTAFGKDIIPAMTRVAT